MAGAVQDTLGPDMSRGPSADFLRGFALEHQIIKAICVTGATLHMTWHRFFSAVLYPDGMEKMFNKLARDRQLCTELSIFERRLAELLCFLLL